MFILSMHSIIVKHTQNMFDIRMEHGRRHILPFNSNEQDALKVNTFPPHPFNGMVKIRSSTNA